jgi:hypothetical protein
MGVPMVIFLAAVGAMVVFTIVSYHRLVSLTHRSQSAWSEVDVQLKRRTDLVPNLVESVNVQALRASFGEVEEAVQNARRYFNLRPGRGEFPAEACQFLVHKESPCVRQPPADVLLSSWFF